jgi:tetratricopeptide (TPR) repeat protein
MRFALRTLVPGCVAVILSLAIAAMLTGLAAAQTPETKGAAAAPAGATQPAPATPPQGETPTAPLGASENLGGGEAGPQALLDKGEAALKSGDFTTALGAFNEAWRAAEQTPGAEGILARPKAIFGRARALVGMKNFNAALKDLDSILLDDQNNVPAMIARGMIRLEQEQPEDAQKDFQKAVDLDFTNTAALFGLGKSLAMQGKVQTAQDSIAPLSSVIAADPKNAEAYRFRGLSYSALYKNKQALEDLQHAIELNPDDYESLFTLGIVHLRHEDYRAAVDEIGKAIEHYKPKPGHEDEPYFQGYLTRAATFIELGKTLKDPAAQKAAYKSAVDESQKLIDKLEEKNPRHRTILAAILFNRGVAERMLGEIGTAIRTLTKAIENRTTGEPDESTNGFLNDAYFRRGICFHLIGEDRMAINDFESAAHLVYDDPRSNLWEGISYAKLGDYQEAKRAYGDAIAASDRYTPAYFNRALAYMRTGEYQKSIADFDQALRIDPTNAEYYYMRGIAYEQMRETQKAADSFASAIEFDNTHAGAYRHMADALQSLGRTELVNQYRQKADQLSAQQKKTQ